jgi:GTP-binding protein
LDLIERQFDTYTSRVPTAELNRFLGELQEQRLTPVRILYGAQVETRPPRFRFTVNDRRNVTRDYGYWVENQLRERFGLEGVPVSIDFVPR